MIVFCFDFFMVWLFILVDSCDTITKTLQDYLPGIKPILDGLISMEYPYIF